MSGWRGALGAALVLIALQTLVQTSTSQRVGGLIGWGVNVARHFIDPSLPAIPDHSKPHASFDFFSSLGDAVKGAAGSAAASVVSAPVNAIGGALGAGHISAP